MKSYSYIERNGFFSMGSWNPPRHLLKIMSRRHLLRVKVPINRLWCSPGGKVQGNKPYGMWCHPPTFQRNLKPPSSRNNSHPGGEQKFFPIRPILAVTSLFTTNALTHLTRHNPLLRNRQCRNNGKSKQKLAVEIKLHYWPATYIHSTTFL